MLKKFMLVLIVLVLGFGIVAGISKATNLEGNTDDVVADGDNAVVDENVSKNNNVNSGIGLIAAALAIGLSAIGSGIAVAVVASSAVGAISENPSLLGKTVIFAGLAEGIAIYGLIIAIMILSKI